MPPYTGPYPYTNSGSATSVVVSNTSFTGNVGNTGTITGALTVTNSTIHGAIFDYGYIGGGILISDAASHINSTNTAILMPKAFRPSRTRSPTPAAISDS